MFIYCLEPKECLMKYYCVLNSIHAVYKKFFFPNEIACHLGLTRCVKGYNVGDNFKPEFL